VRPMSPPPPVMSTARPPKRSWSSRTDGTGSRGRRRPASRRAARDPRGRAATGRAGRRAGAPPPGSPPSWPARRRDRAR
jgi:hypothetical protein